MKQKNLTYLELNLYENNLGLNEQDMKNLS